MIRKIMIIFAALSIPFFLFLNAWQSFRYNDLNREIRLLEREQEELMEKNTGPSFSQAL